MDDAEKARKTEMIEAALARHGLKVQEDTPGDEWKVNEDGELEAHVGRWSVVIDDDDRGLYEGDTGIMFATVVGAPVHGNEHAQICFLSDEHDEGGEEIIPFEEVEPISSER